MTSDPKNSETWNSCPPGTLQAYAQKAKARHQFRAIARAAGAVAVAVCVVGLTMWSTGRWSGDQEYYFGGIACGDVRANLEAYAMGTLPEKIIERMKTHLSECPECQEVMRQMKQESGSTASLQPAGSIRLPSPPPEPEGSIAGRMPTSGEFSVVRVR